MIEGWRVSESKDIDRLIHRVQARLSRPLVHSVQEAVVIIAVVAVVPEDFPDAISLPELELAVSE